MVRTRFLASALAVTGTLAVAPPVAAQYPAQRPGQPPAQPYQPQMAPSPTPDADALADAMRRLAGNPRDLTALITAGELSLKVGDASGAAALFKRAEQVDPMNGRIKAGMARILVTQERPGEALRYFDQAVGYGLDARSFAGDRGLAYDLIGEQERAQRDYRLALKAGGADASGDEVRRRYALSLAISGNQLAAFDQLEPLTRRNDRPAWRARAFVLAMTGDVAGANRIAQGMMPPGIALGLAPFFTRLPTLAPIDKAFAVHFGEVGPTPQRLADARLTPVLVALGPDPDARAAIVVPAQPPQNPRGKRDRRRASTRVEVASVAPRPAAAIGPTPGFGTAGQSPTDPIRTAAAATAGTSLPTAVPVAEAPRSAPAPVRFAREQVDPIQKATLADYERVQRFNQERERRRAAQTVAAASAPTPGVQVASPTSTPLATVRPTPAPVALAAASPLATSVVPVTPQPAQTITQVAAATPPSTQSTTQVAATTATASPLTSVSTPPAPVTTGPAQVAAASSATPTPLAANEDAILARIVQGLTIPGAELGVAPPPPLPAPAPVAMASAEPRPVTPTSEPGPVAREPVVATTSAAKPPAVVATRAAARRAASGEAESSSTRGKSVPVEVADVPPIRRGVRTRDGADETPAPVSRSGRRGAATQAAAADEAADTAPTRTRSGRRTTRDIRSAAKDAADDAGTARGKRGDRRAVAARGDDAPAAKGKSRASRTAAADKDKTVATAEPSRIWVQVAGGANESDLPKAYSAVQSRTPALRGKAAFSTPLRATNRVVTGPFKTDAEARAFVNQLAKQGVSAFPFTSDKGQKMAKLPPK